MSQGGLSVLDLKKRVGRKTLLKGISLAIKPGEFIGIIGPSGAGKSLLLGALSGTRPATSGKVFLDRADLYRNFASLKTTLSYVPQDDIVHPELTVFQSLYYTARMRLSPALNERAIRARVCEILELLEIGELGASTIGTLSGGERKRVNIGAELLTSPRYIFLDEPMAGLDFRSESRLMDFLKNLSKGGTSVIMATHVINAIDRFDRVAILSAGRLVFFGTAAEALEFFDVKSFSEIYERMNQIEAETLERRFVLHSPAAAESKAPSSGKAAAAVSREHRSIMRFFVQLRALTRRLADIRLADWKSTSILLLQAPAIALIMAWVTKNEFLPVVFVLLALWAGCINSVREVVREWNVYCRERIMGLNLGAYLASKVLGLSVLCAIQSFSVIAVFKNMVSFPGEFLQLYLVFFLTSLAGSLLGLFISVLSHNADMVNFLVPVFLLPQLGFSGVLIPVTQMAELHQAISTLCISRWGTQCFIDVYLQDIAAAYNEGLEGLLLLASVLILGQWLGLRFKDVHRGGS